MKLSSYINLILKLENSNTLSESDSFSIDGFDRAILILDDIEDQSLIRDGKPSFHVEYGTLEAKKEAEKLYKNTFRTLGNICKQRKLGIIKSFYVRFLLKRLYKKIQLGQYIDRQLQQTTVISPRLLLKYDRMILLFTGGHIKYAFLVGSLLSNQKASYKNQVASIGEDIGMLRQIDDDIKDYEGYHHEPLGDLINHKKRLPELLFQLYASSDEKMKLKSLLSNPAGNRTEIEKLIFNENVQRYISEKIAEIKTRIEMKINTLPENYKFRMNQLMLEFLR
ncbi:MAG: polyprenyl synthetase family protein [Patescibacteria group bacterium]